MRRIAFTLFACLALGCESDTTVGTDMIVMPATASGEVLEAARPVQFKDTLLDFGTVSEGHVVRHTFEFVNEGPAALLADVSTTCGCHRPNLAPRSTARAHEAKLTSRSTPTKIRPSTRSFPSWATRTQASFDCTW